MASISELPPPDLPIFGDDEDDDSVKPKYLNNADYMEVVYSPIEVTLVLTADIERTHPHLFDSELNFVDFAIRKILLDDDFHVWDVEVEYHHLSNVFRHPDEEYFQCDYHGVFNVGLQVNKFETDVLGLREEMKVSLQTSMNTGKFKHELAEAFNIQKNVIPYHDGERVENYVLLGMNVYNDELKVATIVSQTPPRLADDHSYYQFLYGKEDTYETHYVTKHRFTHVYVAMTVFAFTVACLILSYGCFMSRACRRIREQKEQTSDNASLSSQSDFSIGSEPEREGHGHELEVEEVLDEIVEGEMEDGRVLPHNEYNNTETIAF